MDKEQSTCQPGIIYYLFINLWKLNGILLPPLANIFCLPKKAGEKVEKDWEKVENQFHFNPFLNEMRIEFLFFQIRSTKREKFSLETLIHYDLSILCYQQSF